MTTNKKAVVVGAGIAGLSTALRLRQIGWEPIVYEQAPGRRTGGYVLHLFGLGYEAAERLGILPELRARHFGAVDLDFVTVDGRPRFSVTADDARAMLGGHNLNLLRSDVESVLYEAVRGKVDVRFGAAVETVRRDPAGVHVTFGDGSVETADLLVGADGRHSRVREQVFGPEETFRRDLDHVIAAFMLKRLPATVRPQSFASLATIGRTVSVLSLDPDRTAAIFSYRSTDPGAELAHGPVRALTRRYGDLGWVVPDLLGQLRRAESVYFDGGSQISIDRWSSGRVVLLGDAAWLMPIFAGYGASLAIGAAERLGTALEDEPADVSAALRAWETGLRPEVQKRQQFGRRNARRQIPATRAHLLLRDLPLRLATSRPVANLRRLHAQHG